MTLHGDPPAQAGGSFRFGARHRLACLNKSRDPIRMRLAHEMPLVMIVELPHWIGGCTARDDQIGSSPSTKEESQ